MCLFIPVPVYTSPWDLSLNGGLTERFSREQTEKDGLKTNSAGRSHIFTVAAMEEYKSSLCQSSLRQSLNKSVSNSNNDREEKLSLGSTVSCQARRLNQLATLDASTEKFSQYSLPILENQPSTNLSHRRLGLMWQGDYATSPIHGIVANLGFNRTTGLQDTVQNSQGIGSYKKHSEKTRSQIRLTRSAGAGDDLKPYTYYRGDVSLERKLTRLIVTYADVGRYLVRSENSSSLGIDGNVKLRYTDETYLLWSGIGLANSEKTTTNVAGLAVKSDLGAKVKFTSSQSLRSHYQNTREINSYSINPLEKRQSLDLAYELIFKAHDYLILSEPSEWKTQVAMGWELGQNSTQKSERIFLMVGIAGAI